MPAFAFAAFGSNDRVTLGVAETGVISDAQLLALAAESQRDALDALYTAYKSRIYGFLLRFLADPELADDVTQDAFTKAFHALPKLERGTKVLPWLYRVASNTAIDHLRRRKRVTFIRIGAIHETSHEPHAADASGAVGEREHVQSVLRTLPPENAVALLLHALEGYSYKEIADIQGVSLTAVRSRIARARAAFKEGYATK
jgi:RNA polymerase sigma-70 factor (ECF subfamily)